MSGSSWARREFLRAAGLALSSQALSPSSTLRPGARDRHFRSCAPVDRVRRDRRRRRRRSRDRLEPHRPAVAPHRRVRDDRVVHGREADRRPRRARSDRLHGARRSLRPACRPAHLLSRELSEPRGPEGVERAGRRHVHHAGTFQRGGRGPARDVTIAWTADTVGQGWGIDTNLGGMRLYDAMRKAEADVFVHSGDTIYADSRCRPK